MKKIFLLLLIFSVILSGCANFVEDADSTEYRQTESSEKLIKVRGELNFSGAVPAKLRDSLAAVQNDKDFRSAIPSIPEGAKYVVTANSAGKTPVTKEATYNEESKKYVFELGLSEGSWNFTAELKINAGTADEKVLLTDTDSKTLTAENPVVNLSFYLKPLAEGKGNINLALFYNSSKITSVEYIPSAACKADWDNGTGTSTASGGTAKLIKNGLKAGTYDITILFKKGDALVYCTSQTINVFANMTTDKWVSNGGGAGLINGDGTFNVTESLIQNFERTTFYVDSSYTGSVSSGNWLQPYKTISNVINIIMTSSGTGPDYRIYVKDGYCQENEIYCEEIKKNLSIEVYKNDIGDKQGTATIKYDEEDICLFCIKDNAKFSITGFTIDGNNKYSNCDGVGINNYEGTVTVENCTFKNCFAVGDTMGAAIYTTTSSTTYVKGCSFINNKCDNPDDADRAERDTRGGALYNAGTLTIENSTFSGNYANKGNGVYSSGNLILKGSASFSSSDDIYLEKAENSVKIEGNLTSDFVATLVYSNAVTPLAGKQILTGEIASNYNKFIYNGTYEILDTGKLSPVVYVSETKGDDNNNGFIKTPYKTLSKAFETLESSVKIYVEGTHELLATQTIANNLSIFKWPDEKWGWTIPQPLILTTVQFAKIETAGTLNVSGVKFEYESDVVEYDGGCFYNEGELTLTDVNVSGYKTTKDGGCIYNTNTGNVTITGGCIEHCVASTGGAIYNGAGKLNVENVSLKDNKCTNYGGAIYMFGGTVNIKGKSSIENNVLASNSELNNIELAPNQTISISGTADGSHIGITKAFATPGENTVIFASDTTENISQKFFSDAGYIIGNSSGKGCITRTTGSLTAGYYEDVKFAADETEFFVGEGASTITFSAKVGAGTDPVAIENWSATVTYAGIDITDQVTKPLVADDKSYEIVLPEKFPVGNYYITVRGMYNGVSYSGNHIIKIITPTLVATYAELSAAIADAHIKAINLTENIECENTIELNRKMIISSTGNKSISKPDGLIFKALSGSDLTFKNITLGQGTSAVKIEAGGKVSLDTGTTVTPNGENTPILCQGTLIMNDGAVITGNTNQSNAASDERGGGGVKLSGSSASFIMYGGEISGNKACFNGSGFGGGGVQIEGGTFKMYGGKIYDNNAKYGGGIFLFTDSTTDAGTLEIYGGEISGNIASSTGGGIYIANYNKPETSVKIYGGVITQNICESSNGTAGLYVYQGYAPIYMTGGSIVNNVDASTKYDFAFSTYGGTLEDTAETAGATIGYLKVGSGTVNASRITIEHRID